MVADGVGLSWSASKSEVDGSAGVFDSEFFMGSRTPFTANTFPSSSPLRSDCHYLASKDSGGSRVLLGFIRIDKSVDAGDTAFFYNRRNGDSIRAIAYQETPESERDIEDSDLISVISELNGQWGREHELWPNRFCFPSTERNLIGLHSLCRRVALPTGQVFKPILRAGNSFMLWFG